MTYRDYYHDLQDLCFRAAMALVVIKDEGLSDFYSATESGFYQKLQNISVEKALQTINQSQMKQYLTTKEFVEAKELEAAEFIKNTTEEFDKK